MLQTLQLKPNFPETVERFRRWWLGEEMDRPIVNLSVKTRPEPNATVQQPSRTHASDHQRWMDLEFQVETRIAQLENRYYLAESLPIAWANMGPEITATLLGCDLQFSQRTNWAVPIVEAGEQWNEIAAREPDFGNPYWAAMEKMTQMYIDRAEGRFLVGMTDLHGAYDMLSGLREPQDLCMDLVDCPEAVDRAARHAADVFVQAFERQAKQIEGVGSGCWTPFYHPGPAYVTSCDFWCMVSPDMAGEYVLPTIQKEMEPLERSIFHLDGPDALRHLDRLLALDNLHAIQWVYGDGNGPAAKWIDVYQRCRKAGKGIQVLAHGPEDAIKVVEAVGKQGVWLSVGEFADVDTAEAFLKQLTTMK